MAFARDNPKVVRKAYSEAAGELDRKFDAEWHKKVRQFQMPLFSSNADAAWIIRFDDVIADALELGALRRDEIELPSELRAEVSQPDPRGDHPAEQQLRRQSVPGAAGISAIGGAKGWAVSGSAL